jgi:hypothetical protein
MSPNGFKLTATAALMSTYLGSLGTLATNGKNPSHFSTSQGAKANTKDARSSVVDTAYLNTYKVYLKITLDIFLDVLGLTLTKQGSLTEGEGSVQLTSLCQLA